MLSDLITTFSPTRLFEAVAHARMLQENNAAIPENCMTLASHDHKLPGIPHDPQVDSLVGTQEDPRSPIGTLENMRSCMEEICSQNGFQKSSPTQVPRPLWNLSQSIHHRQVTDGLDINYLRYGIADYFKEAICKDPPNNGDGLGERVRTHARESGAHGVAPHLFEQNYFPDAINDAVKPIAWMEGAKLVLDILDAISVFYKPARAAAPVLRSIAPTLFPFEETEPSLYDIQRLQWDRNGA